MTDSASMTDTPGLAFIRYVLESIVEDKEALIVESKVDELGILITVQVGDKDMGKLIGKGGQTVKALRTLLRIVGGNANQRINLKILEPPTS
jgi:predicted RNA-binding protein YlqC (UPF0109 family)